MIDTPKKDYALTEKERHLIEFCHTTGFGMITIYVQEGQPIRVEEIKKSVIL